MPRQGSTKNNNKPIVQRDQSFDPPDFYKFRANQNKQVFEQNQTTKYSSRSTNSAQNINDLLNRSNAVRRSTKKEEEKVVVDTHLESENQRNTSQPNYSRGNDILMNKHKNSKPIKIKGEMIDMTGKKLEKLQCILDPQLEHGIKKVPTIIFHYKDQNFELTEELLIELQNQKNDEDSKNSVSGGFGTVYLVRNLKAKYFEASEWIFSKEHLEELNSNSNKTENFAIKQTNRSELPSNQNTKRGNIDECKILQRLRSKYGLGLYIDHFVFSVKNVPYLWTIMEYCEYSLTNLIQMSIDKKITDGQCFPVSIILLLTVTIIETIDALHQEIKSFAHGDIKPDNLLFKIDRKREMVKCHLIDFGTSGVDEKSSSEDENHLSKKSRYGATVKYLSPNRTKCSAIDPNNLDFSSPIIISNNELSEMMQSQIEIEESLATNTATSSCSLKRLFGQADDLWATAIVILECIYRKNPVLGDDLRTVLISINQTNFFQDLINSKEYQDHYLADLRFSINLLNLLQIGLVHDPKIRQEGFSAIREGKIFSNSKDVHFKIELEKEVFGLLIKKIL